MLQKKAATKGLHSGITWERVSSQKEQNCVTVKNSKAYTPEALALGTATENPSHVKASEARHILKQAKASRTQALEDKALACEQLPLTATAPSWTKWSCMLQKDHLKSGEVKEATMWWLVEINMWHLPLGAAPWEVL